jgi:hypothetical protein
VVGPEAVVKLNEKYMRKYLQGMGATQCPKCGDMWEHSEGKPDYNAKDEKGVVLKRYRDLTPL